MADTWDIEDTTAQQASEQFGDLEFVAEVKNKLGPNMSGYYSPLLDNPSDFMHVLELNKNAHPDDLYSLSKMFGGVYSQPDNPTVSLESVIKQQLGQDWYSKQVNPHIGSPIHAFKPGQTISPGHMYMSPKALTGMWESKQPSVTGHPMDVWSHELGHSARLGLLGKQGLLGLPDEAVQSYEDALFGFSSINKDRALQMLEDLAFSSRSRFASEAPTVWGKTMKQLQGSDTWATPQGLKPSLDTIFDNWDWDKMSWSKLGPTY